MSPADMDEHARQVGEQHLSAEADQILEHLSSRALEMKRRLRSAVEGKQTASSLRRVKEQAAAFVKRRQSVLEQMLLGASCNDQPLPRRRYSMPEAELSGIAMLLSPHSLHEVYVLLKDNADMVSELELSKSSGASTAPQGSEQSSLFSFLPDHVMLGLSARILLADHSTLLPVFVALHDELSRRNSVDYPTEYDTIHIMQFALSSRVWASGGSNLLEKTIAYLMDRGGVEHGMAVDANADASTWLDESRPHSQRDHFELMSRMLAVRLYLKTGMLPLAAKQCSIAVRKFGFKAVNADVPVQYLVNTVDSIINHSQNAEDDSSLLLAAELLQTHARDIASNTAPSAVSSTPLLETFSTYALRRRGGRIAVETLAHLKKAGIELSELIEQGTFLELLSSLQFHTRAGSTAGHVATLLGWTGASTPTGERAAVTEPLILQLPVPLRRSLLEALAGIGSKDAVSYLWPRWIAGTEIGAQALAADTALMQSIVKLFAQDKNVVGQASDELLIPDENEPIEQPNCPVVDAPESHKFAEYVLRCFHDAKPMAYCDHYDLTALASAYFHLGRETSAFRIFSQLLQRREIPDETDILVLLNAVASEDVVKAVELYERFCGVQPGPNKLDGPTRHKEDENTEAGSGSERILRGLGPSPRIYMILIRRCLQVRNMQLARYLAQKGFSMGFHTLSSAQGGNYSFALLNDAFRRSTWAKIAERASHRVLRLRTWSPDTTLLTIFAESALNGSVLDQLNKTISDRQKIAKSRDAAIQDYERDMQERTQRGAAKGTPEDQVQPHRKMQLKVKNRVEKAQAMDLVKDVDVLAAIEFLELIVLKTRSLDSTVVELALKGVSQQASQAAANKKSKLKRPLWAHQTDRLVGILRTIDANRELGGIEDGSDGQSQRQALSLGRDEDSHGRKRDDRQWHSTSSLRSSRPTPCLFNSFIFRRIVGIYLELRDEAGALQSAAWACDSLKNGLNDLGKGVNASLKGVARSWLAAEGSDHLGRLPMHSLRRPSAQADQRGSSEWQHEHSQQAPVTPTEAAKQRSLAAKQDPVWVAVQIVPRDRPWWDVSRMNNAAAQRPGATMASASILDE